MDNPSLYRIVLGEAIERWIDRNIHKLDNHDVDTPEEAQEIMTAWIEELLQECVEIGHGPIMDHKGEFDVNEYCLRALATEDQVWGHACDYLLTKHNVELFRLGFVIFMCRVIPMTKTSGSFWLSYKDAQKKAIVDYLAYLDEQGFGSEYNRSVSLDSASPEDVAEFFQIFKEIGTFHRNPDLYDTDEDRVKSRRMVELYYKITGMEYIPY